MKRIYFIIALTAVTGSVFAQAEKAKPEVLTVKETEFNFGTVPQGKPVFHSFEIFNTGTTPLKIDNVMTSCGCTTPEWSKDPIPAGGSTKIKVGYNAAAEGEFQKSITVQYNGSETKQIIIKGNVWRAPAGAAPSNPSIQFLKQQIQ
jgi:hypothetical protein